MRTLEMALKAETRKQKRLGFKLYTDVWVQATLFAFTWVAAFHSQILIAFYAHFFVLGFYQLMSSYVHAGIVSLSSERKAYDKWLTLHLCAFVPCIVMYPLLLLFMISSTFMALWYGYITLREFYELN